jgi:prophage tail gpP-like protein
MSGAGRGVVELRLADGSVLDSWETFSLHESFTDPLGSYQFTLAPPVEQRATLRDKLRKGERVSIRIDGRPQATCLITTQTQEIGDNGYTLAIEAKSLLVTACEASVDPYLARHYTEDTPLSIVVGEVMVTFGFEVVVTDATGDVTAISGKSLRGRQPPVILDQITLRDVQAQQNETAYGFCSRLFTRYGLALRVSANGELLLSTPDYKQEAAHAVVASADTTLEGDRLLRPQGIQIRDTNDQQFSEIVVAGKSVDERGTTSSAQPAHGVFVKDVERPMVAPFSTVNLEPLERGRHTYRGPWKPKYRVDKKSRDRKLCKEFAKLLHGVRAANAFQVRGTVDGIISKSGRCVWAVDTVTHVRIDQAGIDEDMWLLERHMQVSRRGGQTATLGWIPLGSLLLGEAS